MKKWNAPEMVELAIECTAGEKANTPEASDKNYKTKTQHCECRKNTNFMFNRECGNAENHTSDGLS